MLVLLDPVGCVGGLDDDMDDVGIPRRSDNILSNPGGAPLTVKIPPLGPCPTPITVTELCGKEDAPREEDAPPDPLLPLPEAF